MPFGFPAFEEKQIIIKRMRIASELQNNHSFSAFVPEIAPIYEKINTIIFVLILQTHRSNIPEPMIPSFQLRS